MPKRLTHEEYLKRLKEKASEFIPLEEYKGSRTKIRHRHIVCGYEWNVLPHHFLAGSGGCPRCSMNRGKTHKQYVKEVNERFPEYEVKDEYINAKTPIRHKHKKCGHIWKVRPNDILSGKGCPKCYARNIPYTRESYIKKLRKVNPEYMLIGDFIDSNTPTLHLHLKCGHIWEVYPQNLLRGHGCPICGSEKAIKSQTKTHREYIEELKTINPDFEVLDEYINAMTPILHKHKACGHQWLATPNNILSGTGCPNCRISIGEEKIKDFLDTRRIKYEREYSIDGCEDKGLLRFDFMVMGNRIALVEYDGRHHSEPVDGWGGEEEFENIIRRDKIKNVFCEENNIPLLRIPYFEKDSTEKILSTFLEEHRIL